MRWQADGGKKEGSWVRESSRKEVGRSTTESLEGTGDGLCARDSLVWVEVSLIASIMDRRSRGRCVFEGRKKKVELTSFSFFPPV